MGTHFEPTIDSGPVTYSVVRMLDPELIPLLRCPVTRQPLRAATDAEKRERNVPADEPALITVDGSRLYRTEMDFPILLSAKDDVAGG